MVEAEGQEKLLSMKIEARKAIAGDREQLLRLWKRFATEEGNAVEAGLDVDRESEKWARRLDRQIGEGVTFVVEGESGISGFAGYIGYHGHDGHRTDIETTKAEGRLPLVPGTAFISDIYVVPSARRTPAARALFRAMADGIRSRGYTMIWTNTGVRNRRMQVLLERIGFEKTHAFSLPGEKDQIYYEKRIG